MRLWVVGAVVACGVVARAEPLYMRQDRGGTISFSNVPTQSGYERARGNEPAAPPTTPAPTRGAAAPLPESQTRDFIKVAGGGQSAAGSIMAIKSDGTVWEWGRTVGQVGRLACQHRLPGLAGVKQVAIGDLHAVALLDDGTVWSWGMNNNGEVGAEGPPRNEPAPVPGLDQVKAVAAGGSHTLALRRDGTVWAWGRNVFGELGDGTSSRTAPKRTVQVVVEGTVGRYQVSDAPKTSRARPAPVKDLDGVVAVAAGRTHAVALKSDGTVYAWGNNQHGELGTGPMDAAVTPQLVRLDGVRAIAAGNDFTAALRTDGTVWAWGANNWGQLGDSTKNPRTTPGPIEGLTHVAQITAGAAGGVALREDGTVWVWGAANYVPPEGRPKPEPMQVAFVRQPVAAVAVASGRTVVLFRDGTLWYWGSRPGFVPPSYDDNGRAAQAAFQRTLTPLCGGAAG